MSRVEGHIDLIRDDKSHAIVNINTEHYKLVKRRREVMQMQKNEINSLREEITEIKSLMKELIEKV